MFVVIRRLIAARLLARLSSRYSRLPLLLAVFGVLRAVSRRRSRRSAVIQLKEGETLVVRREVSRV